MISNDGFMVPTTDANDISQHQEPTMPEVTKLGWYQIVLIFSLLSIVGLVLEEAWMRLSVGVEQSRAGLVWGPFSPLYGTGAVLITAVMLRLHEIKATIKQKFLVSALVGGLLEQTTGWVMENFLGVVAWDYLAGGVPGAITKWVAVPFLFMWGAMGCVWDRYVMPGLFRVIGGPTTKKRVTFVALLGAFLALDIVVTLTCFGRMVERDANIPPANAIEAWVDQTYDDQFVAERFQNWEDKNTPGVTLDQAAKG